MFRILDSNLDDMIGALVDIQNEADALVDYITDCFENDKDGNDWVFTERLAEIERQLDIAKERYNNFKKEKEND